MKGRVLVGGTMIAAVVGVAGYFGAASSTPGPNELADQAYQAVVSSRLGSSLTAAEKQRLRSEIRRHCRGRGLCAFSIGIGRSTYDVAFNHVEVGSSDLTGEMDVAFKH